MYLLSLLHCQDFPEVEHRLFPVGVFRVWSRRKAYRFMACCEIDVKPSDKSMNEIIPPNIERKRSLERKICRSNGVEIDGLDSSGVCDHSLHLNCINEWFR